MRRQEAVVISIGSCNIGTLQLCLQAVVGRVRYQLGEFQKAAPVQHERRQKFENLGMV